VSGRNATGNTTPRAIGRCLDEAGSTPQCTRMPRVDCTERAHVRVLGGHIAHIEPMLSARP
jgi:hypothetical protein